MTEQHFWTLVSLKLSQDATEEELEELSIFLIDRPEMRLRAATMENFWNAHASSSDHAEISFQKHVLRINE